MEAQLQQIIDVQAEQNQLLRNQLRWLKFGLLMTVAVLAYGINVLSSERGQSLVVPAAPIIEQPTSLVGEDATEIGFPVHSITLGSEDAFPVHSVTSKLGTRIEVPPMGNVTPIQFDFPKVVSDADFRPGRGCDGMCF